MNHYIVLNEANQVVRWGTCPKGMEDAQASEGETARSATEEEIEDIVNGTYEVD